MSPLLFLFLAVPVALGWLISDSIMSFVEDLEAATALPRNLDEGGDRNGGTDREDDAVPEVETPTYDGSFGLFDLLASAGDGQAQAAGGQESDLLVTEAEADTAKPPVLETEFRADLGAEEGTDGIVADPLAVSDGHQLALLLEEAQPGDAQSMLADLILHYDEGRDATTLDAGDQVLMSLAGDQTALSLALQTAQGDGAPHWVDADGQALCAAEVAAADLVLIAYPHGEQPQALVA